MNHRRFEVAVPLVHDFLRDAARKTPDRVALVCGRGRSTYREIAADATSLANSLAGAGVQRGDRVVVFADNTRETVVAFWAALEANAVVSIVNPLTKTGKLAYLLEDCRPKALITDVHLSRVFAPPARRSAHLKTVIVSGAVDAAELERLPGGTRWEDAILRGRGLPPQPRTALDVDLAAIVYTSGSTGDPKGVMLTHRNILAAAASISSYLEIRDDEVILNVLPLAFDYGLYQMLLAFRAGGRLVLERSFAFPAEVLHRMVAEGVTGLPGVPTIFAILAEMRTVKELDLSKIRYVTNTAAALPEKHVHFLRDLFPSARVYSMYGLTECKRCTYLPPEDLDRKLGSVGIAIPNTEMWIVDENGSKVGPGVTGELVIRGATVMAGYWEKPEATAKKLRPGPLPGERVLYTGDLARMDQDGYLYFVSRMDDVIKSRGEKVAPKEVENVILDIPGVKEVAVVGVADELLGQAVKAFVVLERGAALSDKDVQRECQNRLENFMVPKHVVFAPSLPKTDNGKVKKTSLA